MPGLPQVGVFDTAFHQTMPKKAYMYAIPYELYTKYGVRRYGFHGTSHRYVARRVCDFLHVKPEEQRIITCHIGNGGSVAAVKYGECIDTSMGLTPLEGLMMGTRSGDIDGGAITFIEKKLGLDADGMSALLNKKSGVAGITEGKSDMRDVESAAEAGDENQAGMREEVCRDMEWMGVRIDNELNASVRGKEMELSTPDSKVKVCIIPTDEELMIATDTMNLL